MSTPLSRSLARERISAAFTSLAARFEAINRRLTRLSPFAFAVCCSLVAFAVSLAFYSPKFWVLAQPIPGSFEWSRALTFLQQSAAPFDMSAVPEPAMRWRILPALVAHVFQLGTSAIWVLPHVGLFVLFGYFGTTLAQQTGDRLTGLLATVLLATTGAVITITNLFGMNDAWFVIGIVAAVCSRSPAMLLSVGLLCPWVDERFLLALPLAVLCRITLTENRPRSLWFLLPGVAVYLGVRLFVTLSGQDTGSNSYVASMLAHLSPSLPYVPLGWWMGFRIGWVLLVLPVVTLWLCSERKSAAALVVFGFGTLVGITLLASDTTRSTSLLLPLLIGSILVGAKDFGPTTNRLILSGTLLGNLIQPFAWITYNKLWLILPLPVEMFRSWKNWGAF